jgi:hypothetical protein
MDNSTWFTVASTLVSMAVGAIVTWRVARHYFREASKELQDETKRLHRLGELALFVLNEDAKQTGKQHRVHYDEQGQPVGVDATVTPGAVGVKIDLSPATTQTGGDQASTD